MAYCVNIVFTKTIKYILLHLISYLSFFVLTRFKVTLLSGIKNVFYIYYTLSSYILRGTGMIASSSTFCPHPGRVIRDLFRLLDAVYGIVRKH